MFETRKSFKGTFRLPLYKVRSSTSDPPFLRKPHVYLKKPLLKKTSNYKTQVANLTDSDFSQSLTQTPGTMQITNATPNTPIYNYQWDSSPHGWSLLPMKQTQTDTTGLTSGWLDFWVIKSGGPAYQSWYFITHGGHVVYVSRIVDVQSLVISNIKLQTCVAWRKTQESSEIKVNHFKQDVWWTKSICSD